MNLKDIRISKELTQLEASLICSVSLRTYKRLELDPKYKETDKYKRVIQSLNKYKNTINSRLTSKIITVVGLGYVGLSIATLLSQHNQVYAVDISKEKVDLIKKKQCPFIDKDISSFLKNKSLKLIPTTDLESSIKNSEYVIIATPTNYNPESNKFDTSSVESVIKEAIRINPKVWIVIKSTVGVGFTKYISELYEYDRILFSPEFLREGKALYDNLYPSRIIVGVNKRTQQYLSKAKEFGQLLKEASLKRDTEINIVGSSEAESIKLFSNTYLAFRVAYFNELDSFALNKGLNTSEIINGVCLDPRIGDFYNNPSFGYGGYCLPKDTKQLKSNFENVPEKLISAIIDSNQSRGEFISKDIISKVKDINKPIIGIYRLSMKTNSDNYRESSILNVIKELKKKDAHLLIYEPLILDTSFNECIIEKDIQRFKQQCDIIVANRYYSSLDDVKDKVYTRDLLRRD